MMKVLGIGGGAREHELFRRLDDENLEVLSLNGNPGILGFAKPLLGADLNDLHALAARVKAEKIELTVVGPEEPLDKGIVDVFQEHGLRIVGPTARAAKATETSKILCWNLLKKYGINVPSGVSVTNLAELTREIRRRNFPYVVKYDGLDAGKGVRVVRDELQLQEAMRKMSGFPADSAFLIQDCIEGFEMSFFVATDGVDARFIGSAQDYKLFRGLMTGSMGGVSPHPFLTDVLYQRIMDTVVMPYIAGLAKEGRRYRGIMYFQLMITPDGEIYVIEINCRFGDPEAQLIIPRLKSRLLPLLMATTVDGELASVPVELSDEKTVGYVLAAAGYGTEEGPRVGDPIDGLFIQEIAGAIVSHGGTGYEQGRLVTAGGRVATIVGIGPTYARAQKVGRRAVQIVRFNGKQWMEEIGNDAVAMEVAT
jgi:phosphoribosylamine--glycine ligase